MNHWNYVGANPVNFTDSSGYIRRDQTQTANAFVQDLKKYQVILHIDWGPPLIPTPMPTIQPQNNVNSSCGWREGDWTIDELHTLWLGVVSLSDLMGGVNKFIANTGGITVWQGPTNYRGITRGHDIEFWDSLTSIDRWTVVHELGHVWDGNFNWKWSLKLEQYTGGYTSPNAAAYLWRIGKCDKDRRLPGCNNAGYFYGGKPPAGSGVLFNRVEDFAESVAAAVDPILAQSRVKDYRYDKDYSNLYYSDYKKTDRWNFIKGVINGTTK